MKSTGIVRKLDGLGRAVLPIELRRSLDLEEGDSLEIYTEGDTIILKKYKPGCMVCDSCENVKEYMGKRICEDCIAKFK
jgi:transcriptional pleiotropic regulator of transition state genes